MHSNFERPTISHGGHKLLTHLCADRAARETNGQTDAGVTKSDVGEVQRELGFPETQLFEPSLVGTTLIRRVVSGWGAKENRRDPTGPFWQFCGATHDILATGRRRLTAD